ncbi:adenosylmethionine decarboxylase [Candidatus Curtissbacteria bacterium]|nr:adenosylmethionine decarboxylase [Candidatus Curtissbacteria bacterium]
MGRHIIVDGYGVERKKLTDKKSLSRLLENLPKQLKMRILRKPIVADISSDRYPHTGYSGFVILLESHISFHTWPEENYVALDVYSCKDFDEKKAVQYIKKFFGVKNLKVKSIIRG